MEEGNGIKAYARLRHWYMGTSGMAITQRTQVIMNPTVPKSEEAIADAIDKWKEQIRIMDAMGAEYALPAAFKKTALRQLMIGKAKDYYDNLEATKPDIDELIAKCYEYANKKRRDGKKSAPNAMDVGNVNEAERN